MADFSDEESDPEMAADAEENAPDLDEAVEEILDNDNREELEALMDPADVEAQMIAQVPQLESVVVFVYSIIVPESRNKRELNVTNVTNRYVLFIVWKFALFVFRICRFNRFLVSPDKKLLISNIF